MVRVKYLASRAADTVDRRAIPEVRSTVARRRGVIDNHARYAAASVYVRATGMCCLVLPTVETVPLEPDYLHVVFGKAFLVAIQSQDRDRAMVFAKALLTRFPKAAHPR